MILMQSVHDQEEWDNYILESQGHPLQLWGWGEVKAAHNWRVDRVFANKGDRIIGAAQLLVRMLPYPFRALVYVPRGPVVADERDRVEMLEALATYAKDTHNAVAISVEPDWETMPQLDDWQQAANSILIPRTLILELSLSEDELQAAMSKKTRQYIRKSLSESIDIRRVKSRGELQACLEIYKQTAERAGFAIHGDEYYLDIASKMKDYSPVFAAFSEGEPVAFLWLAISEQTAFELYGGMNDVGQQLRANYALKWHVIQIAKEWGIARYDMNGLLNDGVSTFKQGFASHEDMLAGTYDKPLSPLYGAWSRGLPLAKKIVRTIKIR